MKTQLQAIALLCCVSIALTFTYSACGNEFQSVKVKDSLTATYNIPVDYKFTQFVDIGVGRGLLKLVTLNPNSKPRLISYAQQSVLVATDPGNRFAIVLKGKDLRDLAAYLQAKLINNVANSASSEASDPQAPPTVLDVLPSSRDAVPDGLTVYVPSGRVKVRRPHPTRYSLPGKVRLLASDHRAQTCVVAGGSELKSMVSQFVHHLDEAEGLTNQVPAVSSEVARDNSGEAEAELQQSIASQLRDIESCEWLKAFRRAVQLRVDTRLQAALKEQSDEDNRRIEQRVDRLRMLENEIRTTLRQLHSGT